MIQVTKCRFYFVFYYRLNIPLIIKYFANGKGVYM